VFLILNGREATPSNHECDCYEIDAEIGLPGIEREIGLGATEFLSDWQSGSRDDEASLDIGAE